MTSFGVNLLPIQFHRARLIFRFGNIEHGELKRFADLLRGEPDAVRRLHGLDHVRSQFADLIVELADSPAFGAQDRITITENLELHGALP